MLSGYFLIFAVVAVSIGLNVWFMTSRASLKKEISDLKAQIELMTKGSNS